MSKLTEIQERIGIRVCDLYSSHHSDSPSCFAGRIEQDEKISRLIEQAYNYGWNNAMDRVKVSITKK